MIRVLSALLAVGVFVTMGRLTAGIPEPDSVLYGTASMNGATARQQDEIEVIARLGNGQEVGRYNFADCNKDGVRDVCERSCSNPGCLGVAGCGTARDSNPADGLLDDCPGNSYVLKIRNESIPAGLTPSGNAAILNPANPTIVQVFMRQAGQAERFAREFVVSERGKIRNMLVRPLDRFATAGLIECFRGPGQTQPVGTCSAEEFAGADYDEDGDVDLKDFAFSQNHFVGN